MVVIRLARHGAKKRPFYYIVATDKRSSRDGRYIQKLGYFNPIAAGKERRLSLDRQGIQDWIAKGAQLSDRMGSLVKEWDKIEKAVGIATASS